MRSETFLLIVLLSLAIAVFLVAAAAALYRTRQARRTLVQMEEMLDHALAGDFETVIYDETLLSSIEAKLADYLTASAVSAKNLVAEKDAIKTLISDISHQTKTPLANVVLYAQLLAEQELTAEGKTCVAALNEQGEKLRFLIETLVKTSRLETGILTLAPEKNRLETVIQSVIGQIRPKAAAKEIGIALEAVSGVGIFDAKWTAEALFNIVDNAVKYTPSGGKVTISAQEYTLFCRIDIADTGIGIGEGEIPKIFGRFYRSPGVSQRDGTGLGLYLARQIISEQGGYIKVTSEEGKGSVFSVFLPREEIESE